MEVRILGEMDNSIDHTFESANRVYDKEGLYPTIPTCAGGGIQPKIIEKKKNGFFEKAVETAEKGNAKPGDIIDAFNGRVIKDGISPTITTRPEGKKTAILPCVKVKQATKKGYIEVQEGGCFDASYPESKTRRGRVEDNGKITPTITAQGGENIVHEETIYRIRKLTPKEVWRLMGYTDTDYEKAASVNSASQLYKQAGNAIVKQVLQAIFLQMNIQNLKTWNERKGEIG